MKKIVIFFVSLFSLLQVSFLYSQGPEKIKGGYSGCKYYYYLYKNGEIDTTTRHCRGQIKYDKSGNIIEKLDYTADCSVGWKDTYKYDDKENLVESAEYDSEGIIQSKSKYVYNDKGEKIAVLTRHYPDSSKVRTKTFEYNEKGDQIGHMDNGSSSKYNYKYDDNGNKIEKYSDNKNDTDSWKITYKYYGNKNLDEEAWYNTISAKTYMDRFIKYDENGNEIEYLYYDKDGSVEAKETYKYDDKGNEIEKIWYLQGVLMSKTIYIYF